MSVIDYKEFRIHTKKQGGTKPWSGSYAFGTSPEQVWAGSATTEKEALEITKVAVDDHIRLRRHAEAFTRWR